jgi:hypothetical protein
MVVARMGGEQEVSGWWAALSRLSGKYARLSYLKQLKSRFCRAIAAIGAMHFHSMNIGPAGRGNDGLRAEYTLSHRGDYQDVTLRRY